MAASGANGNRREATRPSCDRMVKLSREEAEGVARRPNTDA
jgi:hypothetical protein